MSEQDPLVMAEIDFRQNKDPISIVKRHLEIKHGKAEGLRILKALCAGEVLEMADSLQFDKSVKPVTSNEADNEPLTMPEVDWD